MDKRIVEIGYWSAIGILAILAARNIYIGIITPIGLDSIIAWGNFTTSILLTAIIVGLLCTKTNGDDKNREGLITAK